MRRPVNVLHVDDDEEFGTMTGTYLERVGGDMSVETVADARTALDQLEEGSVDCVVSDYDMPGMNGIEFLTAVRERDRDLPFILFTGKGSEEIASEAISAGVTDYLQKGMGTTQYAVLANRIRNAVERDRARRAVSETERTLTEIAEESDDALFMLDGDLSQLLFINSAHEALWNVTTSELEADPLAFLDVVHPEDRELVRRAMEATANGTPGGIDFRVRSPSGECRWVHAEGRPVHRDGSVVRIVGFVRDITERREREAELRRIERRYDAIFNDPNILVGLIDPDGTVREINDTAMGYIDESLEDVRGMPFWRTPWFEGSPEVQREVQAIIERAREGEYVDFELDLTTADREPRTVSGVFRPVRDDDGEVVSLVISDRDITERKHRERQLARSRERTQIALEHTDSMIFEVDADTGEVIKLGANERLFETPEDPTWEGHADVVVHPEDLAAYRAFYTSLSDGEMDEGTLLYRAVATDESVRWLRDIVRAIEDGGTRRLIGLSQEITEETERQQELEATRERLKLALTAGNIGIWEWQRESGVVTCSESLARLLEMDPEAAPTTLRGWLERVHAEDRDEVEAVLTETIERGGEFAVESRLLAADGSHRWVAFRGQAVTEGEDGERLLGIVSDITDRRRYRRRLEQVQDRTRELMHTRTASETAAVAVRAAAADLEATAAGYFEPDGDSLRPVAFEDPTGVFDELPVYTSGAGDNVGTFVWEVFDNGEVEYLPDIEVDERTPDDRPVRSVIFLPVGQRGLFIASSIEKDAFAEADRALIEILVTALTEALERAHREAEIRERETQIEAIAEVAREAFAAETPTEVASIGVSAGRDVIGLQVTAIYRHPHESDRLEPVASIDRGDLIQGELPTLQAGNSLAWQAFQRGELLVFDDVRSAPSVHNPETPIRSEIVVPLGDFGVLMAGSQEPAGFDDRDLTVTEMLARNLTAAFDQVNHKNALEERTERLAVQNERLEEFASIVSHDLRNPLNVATGRLELARETGDPTHLEAIDRALERMDVLIDNLLSLARHGDSVHSFVTVNLAEMCETCWQTVETADATLSIVDDAVFRADPQRCRQLLENLYRNAVEHGGEDVTVRVGSLEDGLYVEDDGPGIPVEDRSNVFQSGFSTAPEGTGFGLRIVEQIAAAHGWSIEVGEGTDGGARFEITGVDLRDE